jgi:hypothetical protein
MARGWFTLSVFECHPSALRRQPVRQLPSGIFTAIGVLAAGCVSAATTLIVDPFASNCSNQHGAPYCDIQAALDAAQTGATLRLAGGVFDLWGEGLTVKRSVNIIGSGAGTTVIDGGGQHPGALLEIAAAAQTVHIEGLTLRNRHRFGSARMGPGGIAHQAGDLSIVAVSLLELRGGLGGALHSVLEFGSLRIADSSIQGSEAFVGGGISVQDGAGGTVVISNTVISGNSAVFTGGGIFARDVGELALNKVELSDNQCGNRGGGLYIFSETVGTALQLNDSVVTGNVGRISGGIDLNGADIELTLRRTAVLANVSRSVANKTDCAIDGSAEIDSEGGNLIGIGDDCDLGAKSTDRVGSVANPLTISADRLAQWRH